MNDPTGPGNGGQRQTNWFETALAHCRPQPAIPALLAMFVFVLLPAVSGVPEAGAWKAWLMHAGVVVSCALAVAAGFCSLAPHALWAILAVWAVSLLAGNLPTLSILLYSGLLTVAVMAAVQAWRIITRRFVPTIRDSDVI